MGLGASCHEAAVVAASAGVEGLGCLRDLILDLAESLVLGAHDPGNEVVHINISIDIAQQSGLDEPEGVEESTERVSTWVLEDLDEHHLNRGVNAEDHLPAGVPILQADLEASLWIAPRADLLVLPVRPAFSTKLAEELERKVRKLVEDLVEHASELRKNVADGWVQNLRELAQA